jgi:phosphoribosyl 1,2-cyclic phosphate phosphodiesterase
MSTATRFTATILGCGSSGGVPRIGNDWGACDPQNPKNRRRRCALLIRGTRDGAEGETTVLIDTGCDIREQLLGENIRHLDAVFYTHEHADHTHGIDDLRVLALSSGERVDVYYSRAAEARILGAFGYCFTAPPGSEYPPILNAHYVEAGETVAVDGPGGRVDVRAFGQQHGAITTLGFRFGGIAYSCDVNGLPEASIRALGDLDVWIVDALRDRPHPSHWSLSETLGWIERIAPRRAVLTNMHIDLDYATVMAATPHHVEPAFDGLKLETTARAA